MCTQTTPGRERACWRCHSAVTAQGFLCPACGAPQPLPEGADLFGVLGLPRGLVIDAEDLERRYHEASRMVHPDRHQTGDARARELSLAASAAVNRAYRTLRDLVSLGRYWLELHGARLGEENNAVPPPLAALVFETQEKLEELRAARGDAAEGLRMDVRRVHEDLEARLRSLRNDLGERYTTWSRNGAAAPAVLEELRRRLAEVAYLGTLVGDVEEALGG